MVVIPLNKIKFAQEEQTLFYPEDLRTLLIAASFSIATITPLIYFQYGGVNIMLQQSETLHYLSS